MKLVCRDNMLVLEHLANTTHHIDRRAQEAGGVLLTGAALQSVVLAGCGMSLVSCRSARSRAGHAQLNLLLGP